MRNSTNFATLASVVLIAACSSDLPTAVPSNATPADARVTDPTATWKIPLADAGLSIRSDRQYGDGTYSLYANGVCGVSTNIFAGGTGDATIQTSAPKAKVCGRTFTVVYPDNFTETVPSFNNLADLENTTDIIPIGATVKRHMNFAPGSIIGTTSRCGTLYFGPGKLGNGVGSDSLNVTRVDASTWHVTSDPTHNLALCGTNNTLYAMTLDFTIVSSRALP